MGNTLKKKKAEKGKGTSPGIGPRASSGKVSMMMSTELREKYRIDPSELGSGYYGVVRKCQNRKTEEKFVIKTVRKAKVININEFQSTLDTWKRMDHPNIIRLYEVFEDEKYFHLILELCRGGELLDRIVEKDSQQGGGCYSEEDAAEIMRCCLGAIEYYQADPCNLCHRDLKPENILFKTANADSPVKIIDFGLPRYDEDVERLSTRLTTPYYIAPEILSRHFDKNDSDAEIFSSIKKGKYSFPSPEWDNISEQAKDFIRSLITASVAQRLDVHEALGHPWLGGAGREDVRKPDSAVVEPDS